jgi:hypothetical protein
MSTCPVCEHAVRDFDARCNQCSAPLTVVAAPHLCACGMRMEPSACVVEGIELTQWQCPVDGMLSFSKDGAK